MQEYISNSFIINGILVNLFKFKTPSFRAEKPYSILDAQVSVLDVVLCVSFQSLFFHLSKFIFFVAVSLPMASPSAYSSNSEDQEAEISHISRLAKGKRKSTEQSQSGKDVRRSTKKHKFQSSMEQTNKYPVTKLLLPRFIDFEDLQFCQVFFQLLDIFKF